MEQVRYREPWGNSNSPFGEDRAAARAGYRTARFRHGEFPQSLSGPKKETKKAPALLARGLSGKLAPRFSFTHAAASWGTRPARPISSRRTSAMSQRSSTVISQGNPRAVSSRYVPWDWRGRLIAKLQPTGTVNPTGQPSIADFKAPGFHTCPYRARADPDSQVGFHI